MPYYVIFFLLYVMLYVEIGINTCKVQRKKYNRVHTKVATHLLKYEQHIAFVVWTSLHGLVHCRSFKYIHDVYIPGKVPKYVAVYIIPAHYNSPMYIQILWA